jgi:hypothetical protein
VRPVSANQGISVFDSGSGGMVTAAFLWQMLRDVALEASTVFFGIQESAIRHAAALSDAIIGTSGTTVP